MKLKVLLFSSALLLGAALFTYCTKETPAAEPVQTVNTEQEEAGSRGPCVVTIKALGGCINVCGTTNDPAVAGCGISASGQILRGTATIPMGATQVFILDAPTSMLLSRGPCVSGQIVTALATSNNQWAYAVPMAGTVQLNIDMNCDLFP